MVQDNTDLYGHSKTRAFVVFQFPKIFQHSMRKRKKQKTNKKNLWMLGCMRVSKRNIFYFMYRTHSPKMAQFRTKTKKELPWPAISSTRGKREHMSGHLVFSTVQDTAKGVYFTLTSSRA